MGARVVRERRRAEPATRVRRDLVLGRAPLRLEPGPASRPLDLVLLDRDGTLNVRRPGRYVTDPADLRLVPGAGAAVRRLGEAGVRVVLVTNQRGIATGRLTDDQLAAVHESMLARLARAGARLDGIVVCPHEEGTCECRKPRPGMLRRALAAAPWASADRTVMIGDQPSDAAAAAAAGVRSETVGPGRPLRAVVADLVGEQGAM